MKNFITILAFLIGSTIAHAKPLILVLDRDVPNRHPSDYGFAISSTLDGDYTVFTVTLDPRAKAAFQKAHILILGDLKKEEIPKMTVFETKKPKSIEIRVLTKAVPDYALRIESLPIADTDTPSIDFFGYSIILKN